MHHPFPAQVAAFLAAPPDDDAIDILVATSPDDARFAIDDASGTLVPAHASGFPLRVVTGWADGDAPGTLRDLLVSVVANAARARSTEEPPKAPDLAPPPRSLKHHPHLLGPPQASRTAPHRRPSSAASSTTTSFAFTLRGASTTASSYSRPSTASLRRWQPPFMTEDALPSFM